MNRQCYHTWTSSTNWLSALAGSRPGMRPTRLALVCALAVSALILLLAAITPAHAERYLVPSPSSGLSEANSVPSLAPLLQQPTQTTLTVSIVSSPWATLDSNNPGGTGGEAVPKVFVVEAVITNTGDSTATGLVVGLNYQEDLATNWILVPGEYPTRTLPTLAPGAAYHAYWFARYSTVIGASHQYTVTALASNASQVATSHNSFDDGILPAGRTVQTKGYQSTGNSGVTQTSVNIVVGVAFTVSVTYDLGVNPQQVSFSPVGNPDFDPSAYRLLSSKVRFYNYAQSSVVDDRLYFPTLPSYAANAEVTYTFLALTPSITRLCSYTGVGYASTSKYDQFYCDAKKGEVVPITGTLSLSLTKQVSSLTIQQGQLLTYTIAYTNNGSLPLSYVWIWDNVPPGIGSIITTSIQPVTGTATSSQVAWNLGDVPVGARGTLTFAFSVDGQGQDLTDNTAAVNRAFFGINPGSLPGVAALTSTVTTTIQSPVITLSKTDGRATAQPGDALTYTLRITNSGFISATGLVITDVLPAEVNYSSGAAGETGRAGQTLTWNNLGPILPNGGTVVITIPVTVGLKVPDGTVLTDTMTVKYENPAGHVFATQTADDTTTVQSPVLTITKSDFPDPVLSGHSITYTLRYTNSGPAPATHVVITDRLPLSTTYQTCAGGSLCGMTDGVVSWTIGMVPTDTNASVSFSVQVTDTLNTGDLIHNADYGIVADQTDFRSGPPVTTLVNKTAGFVVGYAFDDANGNGLKDGGETGLSGITITLANSTVMVSTTNSSGYYSFRIETSGPVSVTSDVPDGYFRTTPGTVFTNTTLEITQTINFGYAPTTSGFGVIYGTVFEDANHNGVQNLGESGLPNVTVTSTEAAKTPAVTDLFGRYTFSYTISGTVTITESNPTFYVSTTPDVVHTNAITGSSGPSPIDFGDFQGIQIAGQVFTDTNVNGVKDDGAVGISGATVTANGDSTTTDITGTYTLYVAVRDSNPITVAERNLADYLSTNAIPGANMSKVDADTLRIGSPVSGTSYSGDFGDVRASDVVTISGYVWDDNGAGDCRANGQRDCGEGGLAGAVVRLSSGLTQTTTSYGVFSLLAPPGQVVTVSETNPSDYASTNAIPGDAASKVDNDTLVVNALTGGLTSADNLFGDVPTSSVARITGTVFNDANVNGVFDGGELGRPGITVTLQISGGNAIAVQTNSAGQYQLAVVPGTAVRITSASPGVGFYPTTPPSVIVQPPTAGVYPNNNFGYSNRADVAIIYGIVYDDTNSNGSQDYGEPGLTDAVVGLNGGKVITTSGNGLITGTFTFSMTEAQPRVYTVTETNPDGYRSTTPDRVYVKVAALGESHFVDFGDTLNPGVGTIYGTVFDDLDGNSQQAVGELGLSGVVISVTAGGGTGVLTTTTKSYGQYTYGFEVAEAGYHTVSEQDPALPGYRSTTPDQVALYITLTQSFIVNFGDTLTDTFSSIIGTVFDDLDGNGKQGGAELGIPGVPISLSNGMTATTNVYGQYVFLISTTGFVQVVETDPLGYHSTTPNSVPVNVAALGQVFTVNFGDSSVLASIFGTVFDDQDANGTRGLTELGLSGVPVALDSEGGTGSFPTNEWGQYTFLIDITGTYTVTETDLPGYVSTIAIPGDPAVTQVDNNTLRATVSTFGRDLGDNQFGDVLASQVITISGYVWNDNGAGSGTAGDGVWDGSEPPLAGATVGLSSGMAQTTGSDGAFLLYAPPDVITVTETNPAGYVSTGVVLGNNASRIDNDTLSVSGLSVGSTSSGNWFGDALPADLSVTKSGSSGAVLAGRTLTYTLVYTNNGPSFAQGVYITDTLPTVVVFGGVVSADPSLPGFGQSGEYITWYTPTLDAGASGTIIFTVTVDADVALGTLIVNGVTITSNTPDTNPGNNTSSATTTVSTEADLGVTKSDSPDPVVAGTTLTYTLVYTNNGPADAQGVYITDTLPSGVTFGGVASQPVSLSGPTLSGQQLTWSASSLATGASGTIIFTVTVNANVIAGTSIVNRAVITSTTPDIQLGNNTSTVTTAVSAEADLSIVKSDSPDPVVAGTTLTYTLGVANNGPSNATGVVVSDTLPAGVEYVSAIASQGTCSQASGVVTCNLDGMATGGGVTVTLVARVASSTTGTLDNTAQVAGNEPDPVPGNNTSGHVYTTVNTEADLSVVKSDSPDPVVAGTTLTYTLVYANNGPSDAQGVYITDTLPNEVIYRGVVSTEPPLSNPIASGQRLTWSVPTLARGASGTIVLIVTVNANANGVITNSVVITSSTSDTSLGNNADDETTTLATLADLSVTKSDSPDPVVAGTTLTYTLVYTNNGPANAQGVYITDTLPNEVIYRGVASTEPPLSNPSINGQTLTWAVPTLTAGASGSIVLTVTVNIHVGGILTNSVVITSSTPDSALGNNADDEQTTVTTAASLYGTVFNDTNGNGNRDADETGISGARVTLDGTTTTTTDSNGHYAFFATAAGAHTLVETDLPGYRSTTPNTVVLNVTLGNSYGVDFGDVPTDTSETWASILGAVFHDANGNGVQDSGEVGLSGVTVTLDGATAITTDLYGRYSFSTTVAGVHAVVETDLPGYRSTTPNTVVLNVTLGNSYGVDFGDVPTDTSETWATILGAVFHDANGNGVQDSGEVGLSGVTVTLDGATAITTDLYGRYSFSTTVAGVHAVVETDPPSYFSTTPNTVTLRVALGLSYQVNFGDAPVASGFAAIYGTVFNDANANKTYDMNEEGIPGVLITLDGGITTTTNIYGGYSLTTTIPGQHLVAETDPPGYSSTTLNVIKVDVTLGRGYPVDFGDTTVSLCSPDTYEKDDSAALARGLGSSVQAHNFCEDATDWITFTAQANNVYTITTRASGQRADTILALYGADGVTLLAMNDDHPSTTDFSSRMVWRAPANGVYYVQIANRGGLTGRDTDYELWKNEQVHYFIYLPVVMQNSGLATTGLSANSRLSPLGVITHTLPDAYEVDDTWQQAKPIVPGQVQTHTFDSPTSDYVPDKDYVRFRALPNSVVTFTVLSATGTVPTLELYGPTGDPYLVQGRWITRSLVLTWTVPDQQYYYLAAYDPGATIPATYALRMEGVPLLEMYLPVVMRIN